MSSVFAADSPLSRVLSRVADLMILNMLFLVSCLPVVTAGAALTALHFAAMRYPRERSASIAGDYLRSFRQNFRQATIVWGVLVLVGVVLAAWYILVTNLALGAVAQLILLGVWYLLAITFVGTALYAFPYLASFEGSTREVLRNARLMSWRHPLMTLAVAAVTGASLVVTVFFPLVTGYGLLWFLLGFGAVTVVNGMLFTRVCRKYAPGIARPTAPASVPNES